LSDQNTDRDDPVRTVDLSGRTCPESFVEAKLALEELEAGERLMVIVNDSESARRIPENMEHHGQEVIRCDKQGDVWRLVVERCSSADRSRWIVMD
jgi:TusA-related sulfurtransferase